MDQLKRALVAISHTNEGEVRAAAETLYHAIENGDLEWDKGDFTHYQEDGREGWRNEEGLDIYLQPGQTDDTYAVQIEGPETQGVISLGHSYLDSFLAAFNEVLNHV